MQPIKFKSWVIKGFYKSKNNFMKEKYEERKKLFSHCKHGRYKEQNKMQQTCEKRKTQKSQS